MPSPAGPSQHLVAPRLRGDAAGASKPTETLSPSRLGGVASASFPGPPPPAPPPPGIFGTFLSCSNFPAPSPAQPSSGSCPPPDLARHTRTGGWRSDPPLNPGPPFPPNSRPDLSLPTPSTPPHLRRAPETPGKQHPAGRSHRTELGLAQRHGQLLRPSESLCLAPKPAGCPLCLSACLPAPVMSLDYLSLPVSYLCLQTASNRSFLLWAWGGGVIMEGLES